jgi:hypothetical protein
MEDTAVAIFDCVADDNLELTFSKGDVIENSMFSLNEI